MSPRIVVLFLNGNAENEIDFLSRVLSVKLINVKICMGRGGSFKQLKYLSKLYQTLIN